MTITNKNCPGSEYKVQFFLLKQRPQEKRLKLGLDCIISYSVPPLNPKPKTKTFSDLKEKSPRMKVTSPSLSIVSLVGASGGRRFLPVEAAAVPAIRGEGGGRVEDHQNVKEEQQQKFRRVIPENDDRGGGKAKVVAGPRASYSSRPPRTPRTPRPPRTSRPPRIGPKATRRR